LLEVGAAMFAERAYEDVQMDEVAGRAGVSRALLYRHFPTKRAMFTAIYRQAAQRLVAQVRLDPSRPPAEQVALGLDAHLDYFAANRNTVLAANRTLAGDPAIQAIIAADHVDLQRVLLDAVGASADEAVAAVLMGWLQLVHSLCLAWLEHGVPSREQLHAACLGALGGALAAVDGLDSGWG
jgi:AcrR family transcriptional regulator